MTEPEPDPTPFDVFLAELEQLGRTRQKEEARGGPEWAAFGDWLLEKHLPKTLASLQSWQASRPNPVPTATTSRMQLLLQDGADG
ncbi:MAG: hypothetical protein H7233_03325 [Pseudorhodobacter sp.]|nr:hypothetical protein [Frankiaceae bacterium]